MGAILWGAGQDYGTSDAAANNVAFDATAKRGAYIHVMSSGATVAAEQFWYVHTLSDVAGSILKDQS